MRQSRDYGGGHHRRGHGQNTKKQKGQQKLHHLQYQQCGPVTVSPIDLQSATKATKPFEKLMSPEPDMQCRPLH